MAKERQVVEEDNPTRIIEISTSENLAVDEDQQCVPRSAGCYVIRGEYDGTYVGYNEPGVTSTISRAIQDEMIGVNSDDGDTAGYELSFLGAEVPFALSALNILSWMEAMSETDGEDHTAAGYAYSIGLCLAFLGIIYVVFTSDIADDLKEKAKESIKERTKGRKERSREFSDNEELPRTRAKI